MTPLDVVRLGVGNLRRLRLRSFLTISGVVIAIGAFVAMLSFGAGQQRVWSDQFEEMGLFGTMIVYPGEPDSAPDSAAAPLDRDALRVLSELPGVRLAYPYDDFDVTVSSGDSTETARAQALPPEVFSTKLFSRFVAGGPLAPGDDDGVLVREDALAAFGVADPDSMLGRRLVVAVTAVSPDSGFARLFAQKDGEIQIPIPEIDPEELRDPDAVKRLLQQEAGNAFGRFLDGYLNAQAEIADTLTVRGVIRSGRRRAAIRELIVPMATARRFDAAGPGGSPAELLPALLDGRIFGAPGESGPESWSQITLDLETTANHPALIDSIAARGWDAFSYASEFDEIRKFTLIFNFGLAAVGFVALSTAALGIVNTMLMSVTERRREIGILRALGAEEGDIRFLFLVESGLIGAIGAALGVVLGWVVARIASRVAQHLMEGQGIDPFDIFATPIWLVLTAIAFGTVVSVLAGALPAARAARVDPVRALRSD